MTDLWQTLVAVLIGGGISLIGVWLSNNLNTKARRLEREDRAAEERSIFQRNTLMDVNKAITRSMRDTAVLHLADVKVAHETGDYAGHVLPDSTEVGSLERGQELAHLTNLILDEDIREKVQALRRAMHAVGRPGPRSLQEGEEEFDHLVSLLERVQVEIAEAIRSLWGDDQAGADGYPRPAVVPR